jgi:hypothetical protein
MDLNHIELPISTIVDLYSDSLVMPEVPELKHKAARTKAGTALTPQGVLGGNAKHILLVVHHKEHAHLPDSDLEFLTRILVPCKLTVGDVAILNLANYPKPDPKAIIAEFKSKKVILFGQTPLQFGLAVSFPEFQVQGFQGIEYLSAPALGELANNEALKRKFWESLKKIFNL